MNDKLGMSDMDNNLVVARQMYMLMPEDFTGAGINPALWANIVRPSFTLAQAYASLTTHTVASAVKIPLNEQDGTVIQVRVVSIKQLDHHTDMAQHLTDVPDRLIIEALDDNGGLIKMLVVRKHSSMELDDRGHVTWQHQLETRDTMSLFHSWA